MAAKTGVDGNVTIPAGEGALTTLEIFRWTANIQRDVNDVSKFGSADNHREKIGGLVHITGTFESYYAGTKVDLAKLQEINHSPTAGFTLTLDATNTKNYQFAGILGNINITTEKAGMVTVTGSFESSDTLASDQ